MYSTFEYNSPNDQDSDFCRIDSFQDSCLQSSFPNAFFVLDDIQISSFTEGFEAISSGDIEDICEWLNGDDHEDEWSPSLSLESNQNSSPLIDLPREEMELDKGLSLLHLLRAYAEAMEGGNKVLARVVVESINWKSNPFGSTIERVAYNLFNGGECLREESIKNFVTAFLVVYQSLPCGRFAHFAANSAILESMSDDAATLHVVDFDIGDGIQWPSLLEALGLKRRALRLTSIKLEDECSFHSWEYEETKKRLKKHGERHGVKVRIEEKSMEEFASEMMRVKKRIRGRDWLVFNCMMRLPHMVKRRRKDRVLEFLKLAKELLTCFDGIVTIGDGEAMESSDMCPGYRSYFDKLLRHYEAMFESLEVNFPALLVEARIAIESLFLAPLMCPVGWFQDREETLKRYDLGSVLERRKVSEESLYEAKVMVDEREGSYNVKIEGFKENEMVLQWKEIPLVRVSTFSNGPK